MKMVVTEGISLDRSLVFVVYFTKFILLEPFRLLEIILFENKIRRHELKADPIFILGHWRSGTSFFQNALLEDPNTTSITIFRSLFADNFLLMEPWLKPILSWFSRLFNIPYSIQKTRLDLDIPGELETAMASMASLHTYTWGHIFPKRFLSFLEGLTLFKGQDVDSWLSDYDYLIKKISYHSKGRQVIVKSPGDTARVLALLKRYPKAKFIYLHRNPIEVYHSNKYLWKVILKENALQKIDDNMIEQHIIHGYRLLISKYLTDREKIPANQLIEVDFKVFLNDPLAQLECIYSQLEMGVIPRSAFEKYLNRQKHYEQRTYEEDALIEAKLKQAWPFAFPH